MNIHLKSTQRYDDHVEEMNSHYNNPPISREDEKIWIQLNQMEITIDLINQFITIKNEQNEILVSMDEKRLLNYETKYGKIEMETLGTKMTIQKEPLKILLEYQIVLNQQVHYVNVVEITEE